MVPRHAPFDSLPCPMQGDPKPPQGRHQTNGINGANFFLDNGRFLMYIGVGVSALSELSPILSGPLSLRAKLTPEYCRQ